MNKLVAADKSTKNMTAEEVDIVDKWIYALLLSNSNEPIKGRIRFTKEFFLIAKKYVPELFEASQFYAYHFGPYSTRFAERVNQLKNEKEHVTANYEKGDWKYSLSTAGIKKARKKTEEIPEEILAKLSEIKTKNRKLSLKELLKEIYLDYPEYAARAAFQEDIILEKIKLKDIQIIDDGPGTVVNISPEKELVIKGDAAKNFLRILSE